MSDSEIVIAARFRGPPDSANGGYACGVVSALLDAPAEVTLRAPVPLETPLRVDRGLQAVTVLDAETVIAEAVPAEPRGLDAPPPPTVEEALEAADRYPGLRGHPFPGCFTCGVDRPPGESLRIHPGPVGDEGMLAGAWTPDGSLAGGTAVSEEVVWAALDCPGGWAVGERSGVDAAMLLGRMRARIELAPEVGATYVVAGWPIAREGRKMFAGSAIWDEEGRLRAVSRAVWIVPQRR